MNRKRQQEGNGAIHTNYALSDCELKLIYIRDCSSFFVGTRTERVTVAHFRDSVPMEYTAQGI
jgi:hypothetical protein